VNNKHSDPVFEYILNTTAANGITRDKGVHRYNSLQEKDTTDKDTEHIELITLLSKVILFTLAIDCSYIRVLEDFEHKRSSNCFPTMKWKLGLYYLSQVFIILKNKKA
jgi:hypothetical protein